MRANQLGSTFPSGPIGPGALFLGVVLSLSWASPVAVGVVAESVKRALPATVSVEWHDLAATPPATSVVPPTPGSDVADSSKVRFRKPAAEHRGAIDQVSIASGTIVSAHGLIVTMNDGRENGDIQ